VLTSDHGEEFLEHGGFGHGDTLYEEVLHVPLIVAGPGVVADVRVPAVVSLVDVAPTVLARVGAPMPAGLDGRSLLAELGAGTAAVDDARVLALHTASHDGALSLRGVRAGERKLLRDDRKGTVALYDLASDPREQRGRTPSAPDAGLEQALAKLGVAATGSTAPEPDAKTVESLKALGYL